MSRRLELIQEELDKARAKKEKLEQQIRELEQKYKDTENMEIHEMVHAANITPEQLQRLLASLAGGLPQGKIPEEVLGEKTRPDSPKEANEEKTDE